MSVDRVVAAQLADAVARLEDLRESINPKFSKALETTIKMMRDLIPDFSSEEYTIGSHITALEDQGEEHAEWQREVDESLFLLETLGSKDVTFDVVGQGKRVTVHAGEPGRSKQGVTVPITYTFTDTLRRNKSETLVSKVSSGWQPPFSDERRSRIAFSVPICDDLRLVHSTSSSCARTTFEGVAFQLQRRVRETPFKIVASPPGM
jgi:hypothetical protein